MAANSHGLLLIADISGYTVFLQDSELEHARGALTSLLEVLVDGTRPPLTISRLEGDAVFSYGLEGFDLKGQTFLEMIEGLYVSFRRTIDLMVRNTMCTCNACANIGNLDLKFFVHHGEFMTQDVGTYRDLVGSDVNVVHRLTKNTVIATTGISAYVLYTEAAIEAVGLGPLAEGWTRHTETYADVGTIECRVQDLHPVWETAAEKPAVTFADEDIVIDMSTDIAAPREVVWDRLADPVYRNVLFGSERMELEGVVDGRTDESSTYVCYHGGVMGKMGGAARHVILEWRPFERLVFSESLPMPGTRVREMQAFELSATPDGTHLRRFCGNMTGPAYKKALARLMLGTLRSEMTKGMESFRVAVEESLTERATV